MSGEITRHSHVDPFCDECRLELAWFWASRPVAHRALSVDDLRRVGDHPVAPLTARVRTACGFEGEMCSGSGLAPCMFWTFAIRCEQCSAGVMMIPNIVFDTSVVRGYQYQGNLWGPFRVGGAYNATFEAISPGGVEVACSMNMVMRVVIFPHAYNPEVGRFMHALLWSLSLCDVVVTENGCEHVVKRHVPRDRALFLTNPDGSRTWKLRSDIYSLGTFHKETLAFKRVPRPVRAVGGRAVCAGVAT